jgi:ribosome assembly protein RRB1
MMPQEPNITATWSDTGKVFLWDLRQYIKALDTPPTSALGPTHPLKTITNHTTEGFALAWSRLSVT